MPADEMSTALKKLDLRRRGMGMGLASLAKKSGVSMRTVCRVMHGHTEASFTNVCAIAAALGVRLDFTPVVNVETLCQREAARKAEALVNLVQGTSALEAQGLGPDALREMKDRTVHELLAGSRRKLWRE
jgi:transcriptional regulator with XRE-family HTH domain